MGATDGQGGAYGKAETMYIYIFFLLNYFLLVNILHKVTEGARTGEGRKIWTLPPDTVNSRAATAGRGKITPFSE